MTNADNSHWSYQYDNLGQVTSGKKYWADGTPVAGQQFTYSYDTIGNRQTATFDGDASGANLRTATYNINNLNEYTTRTVPGYIEDLGFANSNSTVTVNLQRAYRYGSYFADELPITNSTAPVYLSLTNLAVLNNGTNADIVSTNTGGFLVPQTPESFAYDSDGNLTNSGRYSVSWDAENRALSFASITSVPAAAKRKIDCVYDWEGRRIQKIVSTNNGSAYIAVSTNRFVYDGWNLITILDGGNNMLYSFQWGSDLSGSLQGAGGVGGLLEISYHGSSSTNCIPAYDGNGNVTALINVTDGSLAASYDYGPFGEVLRATGPMAKLNPFRFSTKYYDNESDYIYYGYRYFNPSLGRWINKDPMAEKGGINIYAAMLNSPANLFDRNGLENDGGREFFGEYNNNTPTLALVADPVTRQVLRDSGPLPPIGAIPYTPDAAPEANDSPDLSLYFTNVPTGQYTYRTIYADSPGVVIAEIATANAAMMVATEGVGAAVRGAVGGGRALVNAMRGGEVAADTTQLKTIIALAGRDNCVKSEEAILQKALQDELAWQTIALQQGTEAGSLDSIVNNTLKEISAARRSELGNALSDLGSNPLGRNINTLDEFGSGAGFSGVYDPESDTFLAYPSGDTKLLNGEEPINLVAQYGGHRDVNDALTELLGYDSDDRLGFSMNLDDDGNFQVNWNSGQINGRNPNFQGNTVPSDLRQDILDAIVNSTKRKAK